jgi:hypothetical protein
LFILVKALISFENCLTSLSILMTKASSGFDKSLHLYISPNEPSSILRKI